MNAARLHAPSPDLLAQLATLLAQPSATTNTAPKLETPANAPSFPDLLGDLTDDKSPQSSPDALLSDSPQAAPHPEAALHAARYLPVVPYRSAVGLTSFVPASPSKVATDPQPAATLEIFPTTVRPQIQKPDPPLPAESTEAVPDPQQLESSNVQSDGPIDALPVRPPNVTVTSPSALPLPAAPELPSQPAPRVAMQPIEKKVTAGSVEPSIPTPDVRDIPTARTALPPAESAQPIEEKVTADSVEPSIPTPDVRDIPTVQAALPPAESAMPIEKKVTADSVEPSIPTPDVRDIPTVQAALPPAESAVPTASTPTVAVDPAPTGQLQPASPTAGQPSPKARAHSQSPVPTPQRHLPPQTPNRSFQPDTREPAKPQLEATAPPPSSPLLQPTTRISPVLPDATPVAPPAPTIQAAPTADLPLSSPHVHSEEPATANRTAPKDRSRSTARTHQATAEPLYTQPSTSPSYPAVPLPSAPTAVDSAPSKPKELRTATTKPANQVPLPTPSLPVNPEPITSPMPSVATAPQQPDTEPDQATPSTPPVGAPPPASATSAPMNLIDTTPVWFRHSISSPGSIPPATDTKLARFEPGRTIDGMGVRVGPSSHMAPAADHIAFQAYLRPIPVSQDETSSEPDQTQVVSSSPVATSKPESAHAARPAALPFQPALSLPDQTQPDRPVTVDPDPTNDPKPHLGSQSKEHDAAPLVDAARKPIATASVSEPAASTATGSQPVGVQTATAPKSQLQQSDKPATEAPSRPPSPTTTVEAPKPTTPVARDMNLAVGNGDQRVEVRLADRGGEIHIAVRTPDQRLAGSLREDLPSLATRLESAGLRTEAWHGVQSGSTERGRLETSVKTTSQNSQEQPGQQGRRQQDEPPPQRPRQSNHSTQAKRDRKDFQWLFTSLK